MTVFVDLAKNPYGRMHMCHMIADTTEELIEMADKIGVDRKWIQNEGLASEHFDICKSKRELAVKNGAKEVSSRQIVKVIQSKQRIATKQKVNS